MIGFEGPTTGTPFNVNWRLAIFAIVVVIFSAAIVIFVPLDAAMSDAFSDQRPVWARPK